MNLRAIAIVGLFLSSTSSFANPNVSGTWNCMLENMGMEVPTTFIFKSDGTYYSQAEIMMTKN